MHNMCQSNIKHNVNFRNIDILVDSAFTERKLFSIYDYNYMVK